MIVIIIIDSGVLRRYNHTSTNVCSRRSWIRGTVMEGSRLEILRIINECPNTTVIDIAGKLGLAPISVRYHLNLLERDGMIAIKKVRGTVGRPFNTYSITDNGRDRLPHSYDVLAARIL